MRKREDAGDEAWLNDPGDEEEISDEDSFEMMAMSGVTVAQIPDPVERAKYAKFLETYNPDTSGE